MYMEQLSHHPPVTAFHMIGAGGSAFFLFLPFKDESLAPQQLFP